MALIKHAYVSARVSCAAIYPDGDKDQEFILLDGFNNPGLWVEPIVAPDMFSPFTNIRIREDAVGVIRRICSSLLGEHRYHNRYTY